MAIQIVRTKDSLLYGLIALFGGCFLVGNEQDIVSRVNSILARGFPNRSYHVTSINGQVQVPPMSFGKENTLRSLGEGQLDLHVITTVLNHHRTNTFSYKKRKLWKEIWTSLAQSCSPLCALAGLGATATEGVRTATSTSPNWFYLWVTSLGGTILSLLGARMVYKRLKPEPIYDKEEKELALLNHRRIRIIRDGEESSSIDGNVTVTALFLNECAKVPNTNDDEAFDQLLAKYAPKLAAAQKGK